MYLRSVEGKILFDGRFSSVKNGVEQAVEKGVDLTGINLRQANLSGAQIDRAKMAGACLWGANLSGADMSDSDFTGADFRTANLLDTCLAESGCHKVDFSGAYFSRTIIRNTDFSAACFSCPSIFTIDLVDAADLSGTVYSHMGEIDCDLSHAPLIIRGLQKPMIFMDDHVLVGGDLKKIALRQGVMNAILAETTPSKILQS